MIKGIDLSDPKERRLFIEVAFILTKSMWDSLSDPIKDENQYLWDRAESIFEHGCAICAELGVFADSTKGYQLNFNFLDLKTHLESIKPNTTYSFNDILERLIWCNSEYYLNKIPTERNEFSVDQDRRELMMAFVDCDYATANEAGLKWSEKIAPIMSKAGFWFDNGQSVITSEKDRRERFKPDMWDTMSWEQKKYLSKWIKDKKVIELARYLIARWNGESFDWFPNDYNSVNIDPTAWVELAIYFDEKLSDM